MTSERAAAYGRVVRTLADVGPTKLQGPEQELIRESADTLMFTEDEETAYDALSAVEDLASALVDSERWTPERARRLVDDVAACGPIVAVG